MAHRDLLLGTPERSHIRREDRDGEFESRRLGPYRLLEMIGRGAMGVVFLADRDEGLVGRRPVAIKLPRSSDPEVRRRFLNEIVLHSRLDHPNIVRAIDGQLEPEPYLVLERIRGSTLVDFAARVRSTYGAIPESVCLHIGAEIATALAYIHRVRDERGAALDIVHADLAPPNVLVSESGDVKLVDFGLAHSANCDGWGRGRQAYASPEQQSGASLDARSDLYSLGVILWELLVGEPLIPRIRTNEAAWCAGLGRIDHVSSRRSEVLRAVSDLVASLLRPCPDDRPACAEAVSWRLRFLMYERTPDWVPERLGELISSSNS